MDERRGNLTASALVGTGAVTLSLALFGLAGIGTDLRAADSVQPTTPVTTENLSETLQQERRSPKWDGHSPLPSDATASPAAPVPTPTPTPQPQKEL